MVRPNGPRNWFISPTFEIKVSIDQKQPFKSLGQAEIDAATDQPFTYMSDYTKKKIRNLEKRKTKVKFALDVHCCSTFNHSSKVIKTN